MIEVRQRPIEIVAVSPHFDYCLIPEDGSVITRMTTLLDIERKLEAPDELSPAQWGTMSILHISLWRELPDYYKGILSDLSAIEMQA